MKGYEPPFTGNMPIAKKWYLSLHLLRALLFDSRPSTDSGSGWPKFWDVFLKKRDSAR